MLLFECCSGPCDILAKPNSLSGPCLRRVRDTSCNYLMWLVCVALLYKPIWLHGRPDCLADPTAWSSPCLLQPTSSNLQIPRYTGGQVHCKRFGGCAKHKSNKHSFLEWVCDTKCCIHRSSPHSNTSECAEPPQPLAQHLYLRVGGS